jgi:hypothetical protein
MLCHPGLRPGSFAREQSAEIFHSAQNKTLDLSQANINPVSIRREKFVTDFVSPPLRLFGFGE